MDISIFLSLTLSFDSTISISCIRFSPSLHIAYIEFLFWPQAWVRDYHLPIRHIRSSTGALTSTSPFWCSTLRNCTSMQRGSTPPHILPYSRSPNFVCSNVSEVFVLRCWAWVCPPTCFAAFPCASFYCTFDFCKGLCPLLSVHDLYPLLYAPLFLAFWYNLLHCGLRILAMVFRKFDAPSWFVSAIQSVSVFYSPCWIIPC